MTGARGRFITFEGGEGVGKSTQARLLSAWLAEHGHRTILTREPGGSPRAEALREMLLGGLVAPFGAEAEALVFAIARADHVRHTIRPALAEGAWVISDRFADSTWAYQGAAGVDRAILARLDEIAVGADRPDLTLVLDQPVEIGLQRIATRAIREDRFESDPVAVQRARRDAFLRIAAAEPDRCVVVDATGTQTEVARAVRQAVAERLMAVPASAI